MSQFPNFGNKSNIGRELPKKQTAKKAEKSTVKQNRQQDRNR